MNKYPYQKDVMNEDYLTVWNDWTTVLGQPIEDDISVPLIYMANNPDSLFTQKLKQQAVIQAEHRIKMSSLRHQYRYQFELATQVAYISLGIICVISLIYYFAKGQ